MELLLEMNMEKLHLLKLLMIKIKVYIELVIHQYLLMEIMVVVHLLYYQKMVVKVQEV
jgi:hypothetical protein